MLRGEGRSPFVMLQIVTFAVSRAVGVLGVTFRGRTIAVWSNHIPPDFEEITILFQLIQ